VGAVNRLRALFAFAIAGVLACVGCFFGGDSCFSARGASCPAAVRNVGCESTATTSCTFDDARHTGWSMTDTELRDGLTLHLRTTVRAGESELYVGGYIADTTTSFDTASLDIIINGVPPEQVATPTDGGAGPRFRAPAPGEVAVDIRLRSDVGVGKRVLLRAQLINPDMVCDVCTN
jgi:hypothetical protein